MPKIIDDGDAVVKKSYVMQYFSAFIVSLANCCAGTVFAWVTPNLPYLMSPHSHIRVTETDASILVVMSVVTGIIFTPVANYSSDKIGRKWTLILFTLPCIAGYLLIARATSVIHLIIARGLNGSIMAILLIPSNYINEISSPEIRSSLLTFFVWSANIGVIFTFVAGMLLTFAQLALVLLIVPVALIVCFVWIPESPYYYLMKNDEANARESLKTLQFDNVAGEIARMQESSASLSHVTLVTFFNDSGIRKAFVTALFLLFCDQSSGVIFVLSYLQMIIREVRLECVSVETVAILVECLSLASLTVGMCVTDWLGKRPVYMMSLVGVIVSHLLFFTYFYVNDNAYWYVILAAIVLFHCMYPIGLANLSASTASEFFPMQYKKLASTFVCCGIQVAMLGGTVTYDTVNKVFGFAAVFLSAALLCAVNLIGVWFVMPETAGRTFVEIYRMFGIRLGEVDGKKNGKKDSFGMEKMSV